MVHKNVKDFHDFQKKKCNERYLVLVFGFNTKTLK